MRESSPHLLYSSLQIDRLVVQSFETARGQQKKDEALVATAVADSDLKTNVAAVPDVETPAILVVHAGQEGIAAGATGIDDGALLAVTADLQTRDGTASVRRNEAGGVSSRPAAVSVVLEVELGPRAGDLTLTGDRNLARAARAATLGVVISSKVLGLSRAEAEVKRRVLGPEAIDSTIRTNLEPASTFLGLLVGVGKDGKVLVALGNVGVDEHHVASVVALGSNVTLVKDVGVRGGALLRWVGVVLGVVDAVAEGLLLTGALAGLGLGGGLRLLNGGSDGLRSRLGLGSGLLLLGLGLGRGLGRDRSGLRVHDKVAASLHGAVGLLVAVSAGTSHNAEGGAQDDSGGGELHLVGVGLDDR